jgi:hypothetical protein
MTYTQGKIFFGLASILSSALFAMGAILTDGEQARWIYVTLACSVITASFLALIFKKKDETMAIVVGRSGMSILGGVFGSKGIVQWLNWQSPHSGVVILGGIAVAACIFSFIIGYVCDCLTGLINF